MVYKQKHIDPPMSLLGKKLRQGGRYAYSYFDVDGYNSTVFSNFHGSGCRDFLSFDNRLDSVHGSKNDNGHPAICRPMFSACSRCLPSFFPDSRWDINRLWQILTLTLVNATDPIEPPPQGDVDLEFVRKEYGKELVLFGNIEAVDIENKEPAEFEKIVKQSLHEGTVGKGRGFVLMPSASPYGRTITADIMKNYETMVKLATEFTN